MYKFHYEVNVRNFSKLFLTPKKQEKKNPNKNEKKLKTKQNNEEFYVFLFTFRSYIIHNPDVEHCFFLLSAYFRMIKAIDNDLFK